MNKIFLISVLLITLNPANAQVKALTETGKEVILFDNGTWKFANDSSKNAASFDSLTTNPQQFHKTSESTFLVKSKVLNVGVFINPSKWTFSAHRENEVNPEYRFGSKSGEGFAMMITEKTQIDLENMRQIALLNAQKASVDATVTSAEYRMVNDKKVLCLEIKGTIQGIKFVYLGYYFSNENGTIQLVSYTNQKLYAESRKELESLINGFVEIVK